MKKYVAISFLLVLSHLFGFGQNDWRESFRKKLAEAKNDTSRVRALAQISSSFKFNQPDSAMFYATKAISLARNIDFTAGELETMRYMVLTQLTLGNDAQALKITLQALKIAKKYNLLFDIAVLQNFLGSIYSRSKNYNQAMNFYRSSKALFDSIHNITFSALDQAYIGETFLMLNKPDSALVYCQLAHDNQLTDKWMAVYPVYNLGKIHFAMGNTDLALDYFRQSLLLTTEAADNFNSLLSIAKLYQVINNQDSSIYYAQKALSITQESGFIKNRIEANVFLSDLYEQDNPQKALQYNKAAIIYKDSLDVIRNNTSTKSFMDFDEEQRQYELENAKTEYRSRIRMNAFLGISFTLFVIAIFMFINIKRKQRAKQIVEKAYDQLKSTQSQLIQSEKMASLGELTAGIAHEIQNPLNFVNNFSEVSNELIDEMKEELVEGSRQLAAGSWQSGEEKIKLANEIADDIKQNLEKINHHGKRAADIVKGMLQHSRTSSGVKEPIDINALADEYLRLAYHGLRAKDKSFNADFKTEFDRTLPKINVIPQDIGRVLLNLINNAFYAVSERAKLLTPPPPEGGRKNDQIKYVPTVTISTAFQNPPSGGRGVRVAVKDNGPGIPLHIVDKIFQPFFTTKPTGQGTGLGLSLAYDIVKAHGGELKVETKPAPARSGSGGRAGSDGENEGTEFTFILPL